MTELYPHLCSCGQTYEDNDPDLYFCPKCVEQRKVIAKQVDDKLKGKVSKRKEKSALEIYDSLPKIRGMVDAKALFKI